MPSTVHLSVVCAVFVRSPLLSWNTLHHAALGLYSHDPEKRKSSDIFNSENMDSSKS